jgi:uncharacterized membrane protein YhhN
LALPLVVVGGAGIAAWLLPHVSADLRAPVVAYMLIISAMVVTAAGVKPGRDQGLILAAAVGFYVSDIFAARRQFVDSSGTNAFLCYPLYYAACLMFALSVLGRAPTPG